MIRHTRICADCEHWDKPDGEYNRDEGECRIRAPVAVVLVKRKQNQNSPVWSVVETRWPITRSRDWCGEHTPSERD